MNDTGSPESAANRDRLRQLLAFQDTDAGNAEAFELLHGEEFRHDHTRSKWLIWNGRFWSEDRDGEVERAALATARTRLAAAALIDHHKQRANRIEWALQSESVWRRDNLLKTARYLEPLATTSDQFDSDPFILTVGNGVVDLQTGEFRPARPEDLCTRATDVDFVHDASCPQWEKFLTQLFPEDLELIAYLRRAVGYSLTGSTKEQCAFFLYGVGANGKTTFLEIVLELLGTYAVTTPFATVLSQRNPGNPRNDIAALRGARFVKASEGEHQSSLAEATIKEITGGDTVTARFLFREFFSYKPTFKLWLATNHMPVIRGTEDAIWRRIKLIPFAQQFQGPNRDSSLREKLEIELPGILLWALRGCKEWQEKGLGDCPRVAASTLKYRMESDQTGRFLTERCTRGTRQQIQGKKLYDAYLSWCGRQNEKPKSNNAFAAELAERGINKKRARNGVVYSGVGLIPMASPERSVPPTGGGK
jgi:putative DNA primase/helicase